MGQKYRIITNWEPYFVVYFQITLVSQCHSSMLVNKNCAFYVNELSISPCMCYIQEDASVLCTVTGLPFDQMEPSHSMQHRSGNLVHIPKLEQNFPDFWIEFYAGFYEWVHDRLMTNNYQTILCLFWSVFWTTFKLTLNHQGPYNSKMNRY